MKRPQSATVVLPLYDSGSGVAALVRDLAVAAYGLRSRAIILDVLVLDGGGGADTATKAAAEFDLPLTVLPGPASGAGEAYLQGFRRVVTEGEAALVVTLDSNGRHDPTQIPQLVDHLIAHDLHVVIGSRWARGSGTPGLSPLRWVLGRLANLLFRFVTSTRGITDATTSFRVARTEVVEGFDFTGVPVNNHSVQTAFVANAVAMGFRVGEAPIIYRGAAEGRGGLGTGDVADFSGHLLALRRQVDRTRRHRLSVAGRRFVDDHFGAAQDLERLGEAKHFFDWVLDDFDPYLQGEVLEVGAGFGTITRKLIDRYPDVSIVALEPADNVFMDLRAYAALTPRVSAFKETLEGYRREPGRGFDAALYVNVLEHIADDAGELRLVADILRPGGALLVFGPALEPLYSELDYRAGHYRRYNLKTLKKMTEDAGFDVVSARYFDPLGVLPYYLVYRLLGRTSISGSTLWGYDRMVVPASRMLQRVLRRPPLGKNVIMAAVKR